MTRTTLIAALLATICPVPARAQGKVRLTVQEALALAFPDCKVERKSVFLTKRQKKRVTDLTGNKRVPGVVFPYVATHEKTGQPAGTAYFDRHRVRTLPEVLMIVVSPDHVVRRIEVLAFAEPEDYLPRASWYAQFRGKTLDRDLQLKRHIKGVTGATLTARATTDAVRRVLALHRVLHPKVPVKKPVQPPKPGKGR